MLLIFSLLVFWTILTTVKGDSNSCPPQLQRTKYLVAYKNNTCLEIHTSPYKWTDARKDCLGRKWDLVQITTADKQSFIMSQLKQLYQRKVWIGATDRDKEGKWLWVSGQVMNGHYGHWKSGQGPSQSGFLFMNGMLEDCALLDYSDAGRWHDYMCNSLFHRFGYICEYNQIEQLSVLSPQTPQNNMSKLITTTKHPIKQSVHGQHTMKITTLQTTKSSVLKTNTPRRTPSTSSMSLRTAKIVAFQTSSVKHHTMTRTNIWKVTTPGSAKTPNTTKRRNKPSFGPIVNKMTTLQIQQNSTQQQTSTREKMSTSNKVTVRTKNGADANQAQNGNNHSSKVLEEEIISVNFGSIMFIAAVVVFSVLLIRRRRRLKESAGIDNPLCGIQRCD